MRVGVRGIDSKRLAIALLRFFVTTEVVKDVPEIEMRLEHTRFKRDRALVERLGFGHLISRVMDVGEIDERGHEIRIDFQRSPIGVERIIEMIGVAIVQRRCQREFLLCRSCIVGGFGTHESRQRWRFVTLEVKDLGRPGVESKIERELPVPRCQEISKHRPEADAFAQFGIGLPDRGEITKSVEDFAVGTA